MKLEEGPGRAWQKWIPGVAEQPGLQRCHAWPGFLHLSLHIIPFSSVLSRQSSISFESWHVANTLSVDTTTAFTIPSTFCHSLHQSRDIPESSDLSGPRDNNSPLLLHAFDFSIGRSTKISDFENLSLHP